MTRLYYLCPGILTNGSLTNELARYHISEGRWTRLADSPLPVAQHVMVMVDNRWLFIHGGFSTSNVNPISDLYYYDTKADVWKAYKWKTGERPVLSYFSKHVCQMIILRLKVFLEISYLTIFAKSRFYR